MHIQAPALASLPRIRHAFFTRQGGVSEGIYATLNGGIGSSDEPSRVQENRRRMTEALGVRADALISVYQVHSPDAVVVEGPWTAERPKADGMVTAVPGLALGITTADCGPVLFADPEARVIGAAHAGWRGAVTGVLESTVEAMERLGARREKIVAVLGPTIGQNAYEVGPDFIERFTTEAPGHERFLKPGGEAGSCHVRPARLHRRASCDSGDRRLHRSRACAPIPTRSGSSAIAAPPTARSRITAG